MKTMGTSTPRLRRRATSAKASSVVTPPASARMLASWITGPSAVGSEKGMPSSIRSAPASTMATTASSVTSSVGSPQVMNGMKAFLRDPSAAVKALAILLMQIFSSIASDGRDVLVAASGQSDNNDLVGAHGGGKLHGIGHGVGALDGRNHALLAA